VTAADLLLLVANAVYGTAPAVTRVTLEAIAPATLAWLRLVIGAAVLVPLVALARQPGAPRLGRRDHLRLFAMGLMGFAGAFALAHWGIARSTATNAVLLITVEPITMILLSPVVLGETLSRREKLGAALTLLGTTVVVVNGIPGVTEHIAPHWHGDVLLVLSGVAYAGYSLVGRDVLARHPAIPVTMWSVLWGLVLMTPLAAWEWASGQVPTWSPGPVVGALYLGLVITALGYLAWNWALERVPAPRVAIFVNVQPLIGAALGVVWLGEPLTAFIAAGGLLILGGLWLTVKPSPSR
jgi:drug/metabolite transporter (DMT)-like permease